VRSTSIKRETLLSVAEQLYQPRSGFINAPGFNPGVGEGVIMLLPTTTWVAWENKNKGRAGRGKSFPFVNLKHGKDTAF